MPTVVLKLFAGQGTGQTVKAATICFPPLGTIIKSIITKNLH